MADQQVVAEKAQEVVDAVLDSGAHTEGGASVDEHVAAEAQKLDRLTEPADAVDTGAAANAHAEVDESGAVPESRASAEGPAAETAPAAEAEQPAAPAAVPPENGTAKEEEPEKVEAEPAVEKDAAPVTGAKRAADWAPEGEGAESALASKIARYEVDSSDPNAEYFRLIKEIPVGETRTFTDIAVGAGAKPTMARSIGRTLAKVANEDPGLPWWRVVSAMGALQSHPDRQELQLERLRAEGARPGEGENVADWAARVGAKLVGTYTLGSLRLVYAEADNDDVSTFNPHCVEPFPNKEAAVARGFSKL